MENYLRLLDEIITFGVDRPDRTGVGTRSLFVRQLRFDMNAGFPILTTKKVAFNSVKAELLWLISGSSDNKELQERGCEIWTANANAPYWKPKAKFEGDLGRVYGVQWRHWRKPDGTEVDQLAEIVERIKKDPNDRRLIVTAWNPGELDEMALPPCHMIFQFYVANGELSLHMLQRSCDSFLWVPFNISSYALLLAMIAQVTGTKAKEVILTLDDVHIYLNHFEQVNTQLERAPMALPQLWLNPDVKKIYDFKMDDIKLIGYQHHPGIKAEMAV
mgnify:FL=1